MDRIIEPHRTWRPAELSCPKCGSGDVRRTPSEDFLATLNGVFGRRPFRCRSCRKRFFHHGPKTHQVRPFAEPAMAFAEPAFPRRDPTADASVSKPVHVSVSKPVHVDVAFGPGHRGIDEENIVRHYLSGALSPQDRAAFEVHVVDCAECADRILLAEMFKVRQRDDLKLTFDTRARA